MDEREEIEQVQPAGEQEPGGMVPPYEGRQTGMKDGYEEHTQKVFHGADDVEPGPGRVVSDEEREGVGPTDMDATSPRGVGESINRRGEDVIKQEGHEEGREHAGTKGETDRPHGTSDERASTSIDEQGSQTDTHMPAGDQGG